MAGVAAHVFVADLAEPVVSAADAHHLGRVLRLRVGEVVTVSDGAGGQLPCRVAGTGARVRLEPDGEIERFSPPDPAVTIGFALTKGEKPEWAVQRLTEVGVDRIVPFVAARSVVRWDESRAQRHVERLGAVARSAAMQCRRVWLPEIRSPAPFGIVAAEVGPGGTLADMAGDAPTLRRPAVLVGPEGGFDDAERAHGLPLVRLADHVLRAETAAVTAGILLCALRGGVLSEHR